MRTIKCITLCIAFIAIIANETRAQYVHHGELTSKGSLYFRAEASNNYVMPDENSEVYYYVHLQGIKKEDGAAKARIPLNLSIVIDRSGSMEGDKLKYTKEAVKYVINQLNYNDVLSIVAYDTYVSVLLPPQRIETKKSVLEIVDRIMVAGSTNLEGGIKEGYNQINNAKKLVGNEMVSRVFLLSDGLANVGESNPDKLSKITSEYFERDRISISTFGVGTDYNEDLMAKIAAQGGGMYYFIDSPEKLPSLFKEELLGISQVVAKNTTLKIKFPEQLRYDKTYVYNSRVNGNELELSVNDVFSEEQKAILVKFKTREKIKSPINLECSLSYNNCVNEPAVSISDSRASEIKPAEDKKQYNNGYNRAASEGYALQVTGELYKDALQEGDRGNYSESQKIIKQAEDILLRHFNQVGEHPFLKELYNDFKDYEKIIEDLKNMPDEKVSYNIKFYKHSGSKKQTRCRF